MTTTDPHALTGAYAVHALEDEERAAFERHLADCAACAQEVAEFTATAGRLALAATVRPRPGMREQVLTRVTSVRQVPPGAVPSERVRRGVRRGRRLTRWALAASVTAAAVFGGAAVWQYERAQDARHQAAEAERHAEEIAGVLAAPDARTHSVRVAGGTGTVVVSARRDRAVFVTSGMAEPPRGKVYQLWFAVDGTMRSAGLMNPDRASQTVLMRGGVDGASGVGITVEPAGGSPRPTSTPIGLLEIPS
ncbi:anti-sigma factor [Streptomyces griseofuscus]|uniref:Regulator of SigK n=1 Tax=Streptomyces griseofuscus TaxID=146922 RepID=A0A426RWF9_9ACTN|nr:anti-sigma factor [Streptomyces griseofuscus]RRQ70176.1 anti-sigma factor [Streptomyces griseofuscus]RRQ79032.1 anti-sigma factor [Streptomyces griseofuscus]